MARNLREEPIPSIAPLAAKAHEESPRCSYTQNLRLDEPAFNTSAYSRCIPGTPAEFLSGRGGDQLRYRATGDSGTDAVSPAVQNDRNARTQDQASAVRVCQK